MTVVTAGAFLMIFVNCASLKCLIIIIIVVTEILSFSDLKLH